MSCPDSLRRGALALVVALAALLANSPVVVGAPDAVVYPPAEPRVLFSHSRHSARGVPCALCHAGAATSTRASDRLLPEERTCATCHAIARQGSPPSKAASPPNGRCGTCHPGVEAGEEAPHAARSGATPDGGVHGDAGPHEVFDFAFPSSPAPAALKFNHKLHVLQGAACTSCHAPENLDGVAHEGLPTMASCLVCHQGREASARCAACHPTLPDGRLKTLWPSGKLIPSGAWAGAAAHGPDFRSHHGPAARDESRCQSCHLRSFCTDCHGAGVVRPSFLHPANYVELHAMEARRNVPDCSACHRAQSFCVGCHQRLGVAADPSGGEPGKRAANPFNTGTGLKAFHPPGWLSSSSLQGGTGPSGHALDARRNLTSCVSCHREESCLACHSTDPTRAAQIDPHGPGFADSARCRALASRNQRVCLKCHRAGAPELGCR